MGYQKTGKKLHGEDLHQLCCSPDIMWMNSTGDVCSAYGGDGADIQGFGGKTLRKESNLDDIGLNGRILLEWILDKQYEMV